MKGGVKKMKRFMRSFRYGEKGFTLVELLIVVAILGILAALVIPNVATFLTSGKVGAGRAERATLQVSVDGMMADAGVIAITGGDWDGTSENVITVTVDTITYDAATYLRRAVDPGSAWSVAADGEVSCTQYDNSTDYIDRINAL